MMRSTLAPIAALLLSVAVLLTGNGLLNTLLPIRAQLEGFSTFAIAVLGSAYFAGFTAGCLLGPRLIGRVGHIRTFTTMSAIATFCVLGLGLEQEPVLWWLFRAALGVCFSVLYVVIESWLNERATNETRGLVLSLYLIINLTVITIGQMLVTVADTATFTLFALAAMLLSLAAVPVSVTRSIAPIAPLAVRPRLSLLFKNSPVGAVGCFCVGASNGSFWALSPVFAHGSGLDVRGIALFMSAAVLGGAAGQWPLGWLSDHFDRRRVIVGSCLGAATIAAALTQAPFSAPWMMLALSSAWGAFAFSLYTVSAAHSNDFAKKGSFVEISSGLLLMYGIGAVLGPLFVAPLLAHIGLSALYGSTFAIHVSLAAFTVWRISQRPPAPLTEHVSFSESAQAALTLSDAFRHDDTDKQEAVDRTP